MTQEQIDSIRERMCDTFCSAPYTIKSDEMLKAVCERSCPLNELEASAEKTGKWVKENRVLTSNPPQYVWHCSECGNPERGFSIHILTNHCPACGAKMEVEE